MAVEVRVPQSGESISEVEIGSWLKSEGDKVEQDEAIVMVETDKASMELSAPEAGVLAEIRKREGELVQVGEVIAIISSASEPRDAAPAPSQANAAAPAEPRVSEPEPAAIWEGNGPQPAPGPRRDAASPTPVARQMLNQAGVEAWEVDGTGPHGRILKKDVQRFLEERRPEPHPPAPTHGRTTHTRRMTPIRRTIAQRLVEAQQTAALLTTFNEIDMSSVIEIRRGFGEEFQQRFNAKLGFMSFFVRAAVAALQDCPELNARIQRDDIVYHDYVDMGIAVSSERGLVVPVIRNAESLSMVEIERCIADLARRARERALALEELQGGTFTITNGGIYGSMLSTPIINPPQTGILGLHAIKERAVIENGNVVARPMMYVALTYDHRLVDGREAVGFLNHIKHSLENPVRLLVLEQPLNGVSAEHH